MLLLKLEGRLTGPWVEELNRLWNESLAVQGKQQITIDLRETTFADTAGIRLLRAIYAQSGAVILSGTPWTQYLAEEVQRRDA